MDNQKPQKTFTDQIEVAGDQLVTKIKDLYDDASAKRVILRDSDGKEIFSLPLTIGTAGGVVAVIAAPALAAAAAVGGALAKVKLDVERTDKPSTDL